MTKKTITDFLNRVNRRKLTNNTQRVLFTLVAAQGEWVPRTSFRVASAGSRIRDLRKQRFGGFEIECRSAASLGKTGGRHSFYYRLPVKNITLTRLTNVFEGVI